MPAAKDTLPVVRSKKRRIQVVATLEEFGKSWRLVRPNALIANKVFGTEVDEDGKPVMDPKALTDYFRSHLHPDERESFIAHALEDPTMDITAMGDLMARMSEAVFAGLESDEDDAIEATATEK